MARMAKLNCNMIAITDMISIIVNYFNVQNLSSILSHIWQGCENVLHAMNDSDPKGENVELSQALWV